MLAHLTSFSYKFFGRKEDFEITGLKPASTTKKKRKIWLKVALTVMLLGILASLTLSGYIYTQLSKVTPVHLFRGKNDLGISPVFQAKVDSIAQPPYNIALFGLDRRPDNKYVNSDAILIVSINSANKTIKLASIMRDTYVKIEGKGMDKINSAFNIGGPQLAIKTLNQNFNLDIKEFVSVDIAGMAKVVDALGGISLNVKKEEVNWVNSYLDEANEDSTKTPQYLTKPGVQTLNGKQAVAYTRIRYTTGNDAERTARQRTVLTLLLQKLKDEGPLQYPAIVSKVLPYVETSFARRSLLKIGAEVFMERIKNIEQKRFPLDTESKGKIIDSVWYLVSDLKATSNSIHNFIYTDKTKLN